MLDPPGNFMLCCKLQKGVYDIIKVAKLFPNIKFVMMGWGTKEKKLRWMASGCP